MAELYPLRFEPVLRRQIWGGRKLHSVLGKPLGPGSDFGESWEIVDHGADQSVVVAGPLKGQSLAEIVATQGAALFGQHQPAGGFPLLLKFLDAQQILSVQVHPNDAQAALLTPPDRGKTEAWYILSAEPGSFIYAGLKRGFDRPALERELARGTCELCLHKLEPRPGDCVFIPAGTIHAIGGGVLLAEIQQSSDATFRLFDFDRAGPDGRPRPLHVQQSLEVTDFERGPVSFQVPVPTAVPHVQRLVHCDKFVWDRWQLDAAQSIGGDNRFHILTVIAGSVDVAGDAAGRPLALGDSLLLPAAVRPVAITPRPSATLLDAYLP